MHCYRDGTDNWFQVLRRHLAQAWSRLSARSVEPRRRPSDHEKLRRVWANPAGELYWIEKVWPTAHPLATSKNRENGNDEVCVWTNDYQGTRVFGTTMGHHNETVETPEFLDLITRGSLWACDKLNDAYLKPQPAADATRPEAEQKLLGEFTAPEGYDATLFAVPPAVIYPVYVAAAPDGVVYVSVDKNGSGDREKNRGADLSAARRRWRRPRRRNAAVRAERRFAARTGLGSRSALSDAPAPPECLHRHRRRRPRRPGASAGQKHRIRF